jgi:thymidylate synthase (FAD)
VSDIKFKSDVTARYVQHVGDDLTVTRAARVSVDGAAADETPEAKAGLIRYLLKHRHASPFEHGSLTVLVDAPIFVAREWMRHRTFSFNETSGRYRHLEPVFWMPKPDRPVKEPASFRPARPVLVECGKQYREQSVEGRLRTAYTAAWRQYAGMLKFKVAREVARSVLPVGIYTQFYATANPRNWLAFFSLRTHDPAAAHVSYPQAEIEDCARQCEALFAERWPLTHAAFIEFGRQAP